MLFEFGFHGAARLFRSRVVRFGLRAVVGSGAGYWWGYRLSEAGRVEEPRALWVSLALATVAVFAALWQWRHRPEPAGSGGRAEPAGSGGRAEPAGSGGRAEPAGSGGRAEPGERLISPPWRWPAHRFVGLAVLNAAVAAGIAVGFQPHQLG